jgi:hypothetical protein
VTHLALDNADYDKLPANKQVLWAEDKINIILASGNGGER